MDYPKSVPNVGLVNGKFIDENTVTGAVGSLIPSEWGNSVTDEILAVIKAAGIVPAEAESDQLLKAIRGSALFQTLPKFSATKGVATTEFVQKALGSLAGYTAYSANAVLTAGDVGKYIYANGPSMTLTLPDLVQLPAGSRLYIQAAASTNLTVTSVNGAISGPNGNPNGSASVLLGPGVATEFISSGTGWLAVGGSGLAGLGSVGYQKLPSGLIIQFGASQASAADYLVTFPITFPNAPIALVFGQNEGSISYHNNYLMVNGFKYRNAAGTYPDAFTWICIGY